MGRNCTAPAIWFIVVNDMSPNLPTFAFRFAEELVSVSKCPDGDKAEDMTKPASVCSGLSPCSSMPACGKQWPCPAACCVCCCMQAHPDDDYTMELMELEPASGAVLSNVIDSSIDTLLPVTSKLTLEQKRRYVAERTPL